DALTIQALGPPKLVEAGVVQQALVSSTQGRPGLVLRRARTASLVAASPSCPPASPASPGVAGWPTWKTSSSPISPIPAQSRKSPFRPPNTSSDARCGGLGCARSIREGGRHLSLSTGQLARGLPDRATGTAEPAGFVTGSRQILSGRIGRVLRVALSENLSHATWPSYARRS